MKYSCLGIVWFSLWMVDAQNRTQTKRNLSRDIQSYGESSLVLPYAATQKIYYEPKATNTYYQTRPLTLVDFSQPVKIVEPKVASEQVLYEFQQTPTDAISNVHVKQLFQPDLKVPVTSHNVAPSVMTSETVVAPIQHAPFVHNQGHQFNVNNLKQHPLYSVQPSVLEPKKYVYGKIIVDSSLPPSNQYLQGPTAFHPNQHLFPQGTHISHGKPLISFINQQPRNIITAETLPTPSRNQFRPPPRSQHQQIDTPVYIEKSQSKVKPVQNEKPVVENEESDEDVEENAEYEEDHEDYETPFDKYFEKDEDDRYRYDHDNYEEDDEEADEDNKRGSSRYSHKTERYPKKYRKPKKSSYSSKYGYPDEKYHKHDKHKSHKYKHAKKSKSPKLELDARYSEPIPITHKKKILREQWYVSKSLDGGYDKD